MLYSKLLGGLGNEMFIVANLFALSKDRNVEYCVSNKTESITHRKDEDEWLKTVLRDVKTVSKRPSQIKHLYRERGFAHQKIPNPNGIPLEISGYWQTEKYFKHRRQEIIDLFTGYKKDNLDRLLQILSWDKTIAIHVRRGDYLKLQHAHVVQTIEYFQTALQKIMEKLNYESLQNMNKDYKIIIFSDDINWCKNNEFFKSLENKKFIINTKTIEDMYLMSMCSHNIISNSTFSWWGSWLNENPNKIVVAPKLWFNPNYMKPELWQDIYTEEMIIV